MINEYTQLTLAPQKKLQTTSRKKIKTTESKQRLKQMPAGLTSEI